MLGPFWVVEDQGRAVLIAHAVPMDHAVPYGDMLTVEAGHFEIWFALAQRGTQRLRAAGIPTAPVWSEYEEWPRGRVLYDCAARRFVMRADRQLHRRNSGSASHRWPSLKMLVNNRQRILVACHLISRIRSLGFSGVLRQVRRDNRRGMPAFF